MVALAAAWAMGAARGTGVGATTSQGAAEEAVTAVTEAEVVVGVVVFGSGDVDLVTVRGAVGGMVGDFARDR